MVGVKGESNTKKEVAKTVKTIMVEDKGKKEEVSRSTEDMKMCGEGKGLRVLGEINQNIVLSQGKPKGRNNKWGTWERRASPKGIICMSDQCLDPESVPNRLDRNSKRGFFLVDEEETVKESVQNRKRTKVGVKNMFTSEEMVEDAS